MLERRPDCSRIVCKISPFSSECTRSRQPKVVGDNSGRLPKLARPCDPSRPNCNLGNFFPRPPDVFKMVPGGFKVIPGGFRPQTTMENQISFCKDGTLDPRCRLQPPPRSRLPSQGVESPTIPRPVTAQPIKSSHENTPPPERPQNTNGISNEPLNSFNPTLSAGPIKNNIVTPPRFKTGSRENKTPLMRAPKQLEEVDLPCNGNGPDNRECKPSAGCQSNGSGCHQIEAELTSSRNPVSDQPDPTSDPPNFLAHPTSTPLTNTLRDTTTHSSEVGTSASIGFPDMVTKFDSFNDAPSRGQEVPSAQKLPNLQFDPEIEDTFTSNQNGSFVDPNANSGISDTKQNGDPQQPRGSNLGEDASVPQRPKTSPHPPKNADTPPLPDRSPPAGESTPFDLKPVRDPLPSPQSFSPTGQLPSSFSSPTSSPSLIPVEPSSDHHPVSHACTQGHPGCASEEQGEDPAAVSSECQEQESGCSDLKPTDVDETKCSGSNCQGAQQHPLPATDPIKIDNHDCPPGGSLCSATSVPPKMKDAGVMNSQVTAASPPPPSNGLELGKTPNVVPSPGTEVPTTSRTKPLNSKGRGKESEDPSLQASRPSPLPTPSSPPSKANQPGMLNGANQERPRIPQISLDAGHLARDPRPRPVGSGPLGSLPPAQPESKKEKQSPTGGPEVPDPGRAHQLAPCAAIPGGPDNSCPQELPRKPKSEPSHVDIGERLPTGARVDCEPDSLEEECWPEDPCAEGDPDCWPFDFSRETARSCLANSDTAECQAFALAYQRYCNSHPVSRLCVGRNTDPAPAALPARQPSRPGSGVTSSRPPIECSADSRDPICRFLPHSAISPSQTPVGLRPASEDPQKSFPRKSDGKKLFNPVPQKAPSDLVKTGKVNGVVNPNKSRKPFTGKELGRGGGRTGSNPERQRGEVGDDEKKERELGSQLGSVTGRGEGGGQAHKQQVTRQAGQPRTLCV